MFSNNLRVTAALCTADAGQRPRLLQRLRELRHMPDAVLRAHRRSAAKTRLSDIAPRSVVFLCNGNICRSPFAALLFARLISPDLARAISIRSAGFIGTRREAPPEALASAERYGIDMSSHRSCRITRDDLRAADLIVVMSDEQARAVRSCVRADAAVIVLGDLDPVASPRRTILDPWGGTHAVRTGACRRALSRSLASETDLRHAARRCGAQ